jgi:acyl-CoA thioester hydrolase
MLSHTTTTRVIYGDTDNMGVVYYANYLRWFEIGRNELLRQMGLTYKAIEKEGFFMPVSEAFCKYLAPARYDDSIHIETTLDSGTKAGMKFHYRILNADTQDVLAEGSTRHACVTPEGKVVRPPKLLRKLLSQKAKDST